MGFPFEKIDGKPIDVNNQQHRDIVIQRNKKLEFAIDNGLSVEKVTFEVEVDIKLSCLKCGSSLQSTIRSYYVDCISTYDLEDEISGNKIECGCCQTSYTYNSRTKTFSVKLPKPQITKIK